MKITKSGRKIVLLKIKRKTANEYCDRCPECNTKNEDYLHPTKIKNTFSITKGFMDIDCYRCEECGTEWQSKPYKPYY